MTFSFKIQKDQDPVECTTGDKVADEVSKPTRTKFSLETLLRKAKDTMKHQKLKHDKCNMNHKSLDHGIIVKVEEFHEVIPKLYESPGQESLQLAIPVSSPSRKNKKKNKLVSVLLMLDAKLKDESDEDICDQNRIPKCLPIDITKIFHDTSQRHMKTVNRRLIRDHYFEILSCIWAPYLLQLVAHARRLGQLSLQSATSLRFVICMYARIESKRRLRVDEQEDCRLLKKMTEYRNALECICGIPVIKYGRKGKPHLTHLFIENGEVLRWTSKRMSQKKFIELSSILAVRSGPRSDVLARAVEKNMIPLSEAKCTLSLVTSSRTFDIKTKNVAEREWLEKSFSYLVSISKEYEHESRKHVEVSIIKRMENLTVLKHGRKGRPHKTRLFVNRYGEVSWLGRSGDTFALRDIISIQEGLHTQVFERARKYHCTPQTCFSLVTLSRTLDIETQSEHVRDWFVVAFRYLMEKVHSKEIEHRRKRAEKQLKLLQDLCRHNNNSQADLYDVCH